jgi:peptidoglycan-N-acetylglucosamine deacetylase
MTADTDPRVTVLLTFDFDAVALWISSFGATSPAHVARGEFGARVGAPRVLDLLDEFGITCTWFIPGHTIESFPAICERVVEAGHDVQHHGYVHEPIEHLARDDEARLLDLGSDAIERLAGRRPTGYRSPSWNMSPHTVALLLERGFIYDSSLMADDLRMYRVREGDVVATDGPLRFGRETSLVEVPVSWHLDDFPPFTYVWDPPRQGYADTATIEHDWLAHLDFAWERAPGSVLTITMHPQVTGRPHVLAMLRRVVEAARGRDGVVFSTMTDAVHQWIGKGAV